MGGFHPGAEALHGGEKLPGIYIPGAKNVPPFPELVTNAKTGTMCAVEACNCHY